jgi:probable F420-dependent oxidoreductase
MKLGVNVPNFGPTVDPSSIHAWVRFAEDAGFSLAMLSDHVAVTPDVAALYPAPFYEPFTTLAWLAGTTERIELGTTVTVVPYRDPLLTARMTTAIDRFSNGRLVLGVGIGWSEPEFAALGVPFRRRGAITDEYLAALRTLWTTDVASFEGEFVGFRDVHSGPRPSRSPHPPVWVGGSSPAALRRAVTLGEAWHPIGPRPGWLRTTGLPALRRTADRTGLPLPALCPRINLRLRSTPAADDERLSGEGTLTQVLADLEELEDLGAEAVVLDTNPDDPADRLATDEEWRDLERVVSARSRRQADSR